MIKLANPKYDSYGVLVIKDEDIELLAYRQLRDYKKDYFKEPHPLDIDDFVENYLGIAVCYHGLSLDKSILGATALADGFLPVLDSKNELSCREVKKGQIVIDCEACHNTESCVRFTLGHESAHSQFDMNVELGRTGVFDAISDTHVDLFGQTIQAGRRRTPREWMEHHANKYATCLLMPKRFVAKLWKKYHDEYFPGKRITFNSPKRLWKIIHDMASDLGVSQSSMALRLVELNIVSRKMFDSLQLNKKEVGQQSIRQKQ